MYEHNRMHELAIYRSAILCASLQMLVYWSLSIHVKFIRRLNVVYTETEELQPFVILLLVTYFYKWQLQGSLGKTVNVWRIHLFKTYLQKSSLILRLR